MHSSVTMKTFIIFACLLVFAQAMSQQQMEKLARQRSECLLQIRAGDQLISKLQSGDFKSESDGLKKYAHCMLVKAELMTRNGEFRKEVALANVPAGDRPAVEILIDACLAEKGVTPQDTAWNYIKCYNEKDPKHATIL